MSHIRSEDCVKYIISRLCPMSQEKDWKRVKKYEDDEETVRVFEHRTIGKKIAVREWQGRLGSRDFQRYEDWEEEKKRMLTEANDPEILFTFSPEEMASLTPAPTAATRFASLVKFVPLDQSTIDLYDGDCSGRFIYAICSAEESEPDMVCFECNPEQKNGFMCDREDHAIYEKLEKLFKDMGIEVGATETAHFIPIPEGKTREEIEKVVEERLVAAGAVKMQDVKELWKKAGKEKKDEEEDEKIVEKVESLGNGMVMINQSVKRPDKPAQEKDRWEKKHQEEHRIHNWIIANLAPKTQYYSWKCVKTDGNRMLFKTKTADGYGDGAKTAYRVAVVEIIDGPAISGRFLSSEEMEKEAGGKLVPLDFDKEYERIKDDKDDGDPKDWIRKLKKEVTGRVIFGVMPDDYAREGEIQFYCGPEDKGGALNDSYDIGSYDILETIFLDQNVDIGASENSHMLTIPEGKTREEMVKLICDRLVKAGGVDKGWENEE